MAGLLNLVSGVEGIVANIKRKTDTMATKTEKALKLAGLNLQRASMERVPVNFGILKASAFTRAEGEGFKTVVSVGYTAAYALYVHEAIEMKLLGKPRPKGRGHYWDPQGQAQAKFLEGPLREMLPEIKNSLREALKI